jgi:hypothetical protein
MFLFFCNHVLGITFDLGVSTEENLCPRKRRMTMMTKERLVAKVVLSALRSDGAVVDSHPFPVVLVHLWGDEVA